MFVIEAQLQYIIDCLHTMKRWGLLAVEVRPDREETFNRELQRRMRRTIWTSGCASWYLDASGRNTTLWPGFTFEFWRRTRHFDPQHYNLLSRTTSPRVGTAAP